MTTTVTQTKAQTIAAGLRALADMIEASPELVDKAHLGDRFNRMLVPAWTRDEVAAAARAGLRSGAKVDKHVGDKYAGVNVVLNEMVSLHVYVDREEVCERIVVGTRDVTEEVPDPDALAAVPTVTVTKTVEDVEWRCTSLLSEATS